MLRHISKGKARRGCAGFTLAEVLAALTFMAIVIPVAIQGMRVASLAGQVSVRKALATQVAEQQLNEAIVSGQWRTASPEGLFERNGIEFKWRLHNEPWDIEAMRLVSIQVTYQAQGRDYDVYLSTLLDTTVTP